MEVDRSKIKRINAALRKCNQQINTLCRLSNHRHKRQLNNQTTVASLEHQRRLKLLTAKKDILEYDLAIESEEAHLRYLEFGAFLNYLEKEESYQAMKEITQKIKQMQLTKEVSLANHDSEYALILAKMAVYLGDTPSAYLGIANLSFCRRQDSEEQLISFNLSNDQNNLKAHKLLK